MSPSSVPKLEGIDHIHVYVRNRTHAEKWYAEKLGYRRVGALEVWATPDGPLTLANAEGNVHLALFQRDNPTPANVIAFASAGSEFVRWVAHLRSADTEVQIKDHTLAVSMYFEDLDQNLMEITTYDHAMVRTQLGLLEDLPL